MPIPENNLNQWSALSLKDKAGLISSFVQNGVTSIVKMKEIFNNDINHALSSNKDFVQRLRDYPNTPVIENEDGSHSTHLMNSGEVDGRGVVWPSIQRQNGQLRDFRDYEDGGLDEAIRQNDTLQMHPVTARYYAENYKRYYPNMKETGGPLENILSRWGKMMGNPMRQISDDEIVDAYLNNVLWTMENPTNKGYNKKTGLYYSYIDKDVEGKEHTNIGPGIEKNGHPNVDYSRGYTREELNKIARSTVADRVKAMSESMDTMQDGRYSLTRDTLSMGPLLIMADIAYNAKTEEKKNMPEKWPKLMAKLATGDFDGIIKEKQTRSKNERRMFMRNDLLTYDKITPQTVKNR